MEKKLSPRFLLLAEKYHIIPNYDMYNYKQSNFCKFALQSKVRPNYQNLRVVTCSVLLFLIMILPNANAQENPAADIIKKSQENLQKFEQKSANTVQPPAQKVPTSVTSTPKTTADFVNSNFAVLFANPDNYKDSTIDVTGKVANFPEVGMLQMYIEGAVRHDAVVHYNASFVFVEDDCVKVTGKVEDQFYGTNAFSATRIVPSISARTIDKIDCTQAINPALKTVVLEKTQMKGGIKVVFHKVEFSDKNTRVYLTVDNLNQNIGFYDFNAKALQGKKQYSTTYSYDVTYPQIKSDIPPGIEENGVVLFDPLDYKIQRSAKFQFEATRQDTYASFNFVFLVSIPK